MSDRRDKDSSLLRSTADSAYGTFHAERAFVSVASAASSPGISASRVADDSANEEATNPRNRHSNERELLSSPKSLRQHRPTIWERIFFVFFASRELVAIVETMGKQQFWETMTTNQLGTLAGDSLELDAIRRETYDQLKCGRILRAIWKTEWKTLMLSGFYQLCSCISDSAAPLLLYILLNMVIGREYDMPQVYGFLVLIYVVALLQLVFRSHGYYHGLTANVRVTGILRALLFESTVKQPQSHQQHHKKRMAEIVHMYSEDITKVGEMISQFQQLWRNILQVAFELATLVKVLDINFLVITAALAAICSLLVLELNIGAYYQQKWDKKAQTRLNVIHECFKNIQMVKLNAWEDKMKEKISQARTEEYHARWVATVLNTVWYSLIQDAPTLVSVFIFSWEAAHHDSFSPARMFTALLLFRRIKVNLFAVVALTEIILNGKVAVRNIEKHFQDCSVNRKAAVAAEPRTRRDSNVTIAVERASFSPSAGVTKPLLINVNLSVRRGELVVVHGKAGAGKTTLLAGLLGNVSKLSGDVYLDRSCKIAYCAQEPWLQTLSIRDNILFGAAFDERKYWCVLDACCLDEDLKMLPDGDKTKVGPKGINLSGGQKARIALARACYADADLYLVDCPFSNVDAIVQSDIFTKCIVELLRYKTVVLVTHNQEIISSTFVDSVVKVDNLYVQQTANVQHKKSKSENAAISNRQFYAQSRLYRWKSSVPVDTSLTAITALNLYEIPEKQRHELSKMPSLLTAASLATTTDGDGWFSSDTLATLFPLKHSLRFFVCTFAVMLAFGVVNVAKDLCLMSWSAVPIERASTDVIMHFAIEYGVFVIATLVMGIVIVLLLLRVALTASDRVFAEMTTALFHAPISFFYSTTIGEILNAYFHGIAILDAETADLLNKFLRSAILLLTSDLVIWYFSGWAGVTVLLIVVYMIKEGVVMGHFVGPYEFGFRSEAVNLSFISEALDGTATIRAFGTAQVDRFCSLHREIAVHLSRRGYYEAVISFTHILSLRIHGMHLVLLAFVLSVRTLQSSELGLLLYYTFALLPEIYHLSFGAFEAILVLSRIKRLREFSEIEPESDTSLVTPHSAPANWPHHGEVVFERVWFGYSNKLHCGSAMALRDVTFSVRGGEKIGVVGRTGSGKSSLAMAIFRMHNLTSGQILIDGVDVSSLSLTELRKNLCIIPQTPLFYRCSVRHYLDPFNEFDDMQLWSELHKCGLGKGMEGLDTELWDNGENWSMGERQMLCLARALLKPSRVVILDESFSSVDQTAEEKLVEILNDNFQHSTVFLITHRLDQVLQFDRIMVMQRGALVEYGTAAELASNSDSVFYEFLETTLLTF
ncbi:Multidrug resistance-associated protein 1, partial [Globisporangium splendens]